MAGRGRRLDCLRSLYAALRARRRRRAGVCWWSRSWWWPSSSSSPACSSGGASGRRAPRRRPHHRAARAGQPECIGDHVGLASVDGRCHPKRVEVTQSDIAGMPPGNLRVPQGAFVALWQAASTRDAEQGARGVTDWHAGAIALTCRWMAAAPLRTARGGGLVRAPATRRRALAYEELIEQEFLAAQDLEHRRPDLAGRPGWCEGVRATLRWAWRAEGPPPLELPATAALGVLDHTST